MMVLRSKVRPESPIDISTIVAMAQSGKSFDFSELSNEDLLAIETQFLALTLQMDNARERELNLGRGIMRCEACLTVELRTDADFHFSSEWQRQHVYFEIHSHVCEPADVAI